MKTVFAIITLVSTVCCNLTGQVDSLTMDVLNRKKVITVINDTTHIMEYGRLIDSFWIDENMHENRPITYRATKCVLDGGHEYDNKSWQINFDFCVDIMGNVHYVKVHSNQAKLLSNEDVDHIIDCFFYYEADYDPEGPKQHCGNYHFNSSF